MRKIVLGCAAVLLSLGLLAGCNNEESDKVVSIKVDNTATVVVGESLALPYTVEPEKAKVEVLNDHEEYVTASADAGLLCLDGLAEGSATITLVGTYKKYEEANVNISVSVVPESTAEQGPGPETGGSGSGGDGNTGTIEPGPEEEPEPHSHDVVVTSPDNKGVYVLGYSGEEGDTYLTYEESELGSSMTYSSAVSVRTLAVEGGYNLQLGEEEYLGAKDGALAVEDTATTVEVDATSGAITCNSLTLTIDDEGAFVWAETAVTAVVLMDVAYDHDAAVIEDSTNLVLGIIVDGTYEYITGDTVGYTNRGVLSSDISEAAVITLTANAAAENAYEMTFVDSEGDTRWITIRAVTQTDDGASSDTTGFQYEKEEALIYWDETNEYWTNAEGTYYLSLWSNYSCLGASTVGSSGASYAPAILYYDSTVPALRGVAIEDTSESVPYAGTLQLEYQLYPTCLEDASSLVWTGDTYVSVENGLVKGLGIADEAVVTVSGEGIFGDSITLKVESIPVTTVVNSEYIINNFTHADGTEYTLGSGSPQDTDPCVIATSSSSTTMNFNDVFGITWTGGGSPTRLWTGNLIRVYKNSITEIAAASGWKITEIVIVSNQNSNYTFTIGGATQSYTWSGSSSAGYTLTASGLSIDSTSSFVMTLGSSASTTSLTSITVTCEVAA